MRAVPLAKVGRDLSPRTYMNVDEAVNISQVLPQGNLVLLLSLVNVPVKHLQHGVLAVHVALVALGDDFNLFADLFQLQQRRDIKRHKHKTALEQYLTT